MKMGKVLIAGVAVTIFNTVVAMVTCGSMFNWVYQIDPTYVWKPMEGGGPAPLFYVGSLVMGIIFAAVYDLLHKGIPASNKLVRGLAYGLCVWAVGMLPGMLATYAFMTVAPIVVIYWTLLGLVQTPLAGLVVSLFYKE